MDKLWIMTICCWFVFGFLFPCVEKIRTSGSFFISSLVFFGFLHLFGLPVLCCFNFWKRLARVLLYWFHLFDLIFSLRKINNLWWGLKGKTRYKNHYLYFSVTIKNHLVTLIYPSGWFPFYGSILLLITGCYCRMMDWIHLTKKAFVNLPFFFPIWMRSPPFSPIGCGFLWLWTKLDCELWKISGKIPLFDCTT